MDFKVRRLDDSDLDSLTCFFLGHCAAQLRLIFHIRGTISGTGIFLAYVQRFDIVPQANPSARGTGTRSLESQRDPASGMFVLKRSLRADNSRRGDVIPLSRLRTPIQLVPRFGATADSRLTKQTSLEYSTKFWLNKYAEKEDFWALDAA